MVSHEAGHVLFEYLEVDLLGVDLLVEVWWEDGVFQDLLLGGI